MSFSFGSYYPTESILHRIDPRAKLLFGAAFTVVLIFARSFWALGGLACITLALFAYSNIPAGKAIRSVAPLMAIVVLAALANLFFTPSGSPLVELGPVRITDEGARSCGFITIRLTLMMLVMSLVTLTTTTLDLTEATERLLSPLARFGFPAHEIGMILGIALRFLPQFATELVTIYRAQISRGAAAVSGPASGLRMLASLTVPLFTSAFRRAETLSQAMDARCYHGAPGRTRLHELHFAARDASVPVVLAICIAIVAAL